MIEPAVLFEPIERMEIDPAAIMGLERWPSDTFGDHHYQGYFADYAGIARKYRPRRILEIGVRYGYTGICMCLGYRAARPKAVLEYVGLDNESYLEGSCTVAGRNFALAVPSVASSIIQWDTLNGLPADIGTFDMIHIDGDHRFEGALSDLRASWEVLNPNGILLVDDVSFPEVHHAVEIFLEQFEDSSLNGRFQFHENVQGHAYIQRGENG